MSKQRKITNFKTVGTPEPLNALPAMSFKVCWNEMFRVSSSSNLSSQIHSMAALAQGLEPHHLETIKTAGDKRIIASGNAMVR